MRFLSLMLLLAPNTQGLTDHLNYGVSFKDLGPIEFSVYVWKYSYLIELPREIKRHGLLNDFNHTVKLIDELLPYTLIPQNKTRKINQLTTRKRRVYHNHARDN